MRHFFLVIILFCSGLAFCPAGYAGADTPAELTISPEVLNVGTFFDGGQITVSGEISAAEDVVVEIIGPHINSLFDVKGRIGPFWMTREKADLENAPALYLLLMPSGPDWAQKASGLNLGIENLRRQINISLSETAPDDIFRMFVKLKRSEKLYSEVPGAVSYETVENGGRRFTATYRLPSSTAVGRYSIKATRINDGQRGPELSAELTVQQVGFVQMVDELASNRRVTYGVAAVLIALFSGAVMGLIFKGGGGH